MTNNAWFHPTGISRRNDSSLVSLLKPPSHPLRREENYELQEDVVWKMCILFFRHVFRYDFVCADLTGWMDIL
jgi:hypothetical protein